MVGTVALIAILLALPFWATADALRYTHSEWSAIGQDRSKCLLVILLLGPVGASVYAMGPRERLVSARRRLKSRYARKDARRKPPGAA